MPRILGVDIPNDKRTVISLRYIYGIGPFLADQLCERAGIDPDKRARDLTEDDLAKLANLLDNEYVVEGQLRRQVQQNIARLRDIGCYRGLRHRKGLPSAASAPGPTPGPARARARRSPARRASRTCADPGRPECRRADRIRAPRSGRDPTIGPRPAGRRSFVESHCREFRRAHRIESTAPDPIGATQREHADPWPRPRSGRPDATSAGRSCTSRRRSTTRLVTITDPNGDALCWASSRHRRLQGQPQEHAVRRPARRRDGRLGGHEVRRQGGRGQGQGPRLRPRERHHRPAGLRPLDQGHRGRHPPAPQRLPPAQEAARLIADLGDQSRSSVESASPSRTEVIDRSDR